MATLNPEQSTTFNADTVSRRDDVATDADVQQPRRSKRSDSLWSRTVQGRWLTGAFFVRYWLSIMMFIGMVLIYITTRYSYQRSMEEIRTLTNRLEVVRTESFRVRGEYMSRIRESSMRQTLDSLGVPLSVQLQPPYHLKYNADK